MKVHVVYMAVILGLLAVVGANELPRFTEQEAAVAGPDGRDSYLLRMRPSGDLIFENTDHLPFASSRDYWGDLTISSEDWLDRNTVLLGMSDGTKIKVHLGRVEIIHP